MRMWTAAGAGGLVVTAASVLAGNGLIRSMWTGELFIVVGSAIYAGFLSIEKVVSHSSDTGTKAEGSVDE